jgi:hypothetical protein
MNAGMTQSLCQRADDLYRNREDRRSVSESIKLLSDLTDASSDFEVQWRLSRAFFYLGQEEVTRQLKALFFCDGITSGKKAATIEPDRVEGHFWLGVNLGLLAETAGPFQALGFARRALKHLQRSIAIAPEYHGAGPLRVYARMKHKLPWPIGSKLESESCFRRAIALCANNSVTRIYFADLLHQIGRLDDENAELRAVIAMPENEDWRFELSRDKAIAANRLRQ